MLTDPQAWASLLTLTALEVVPSIDNLVVIAMLVGDFVEKHPTVKILALGFLTMIGMALVADGFGAHIPKVYLYTAMVFSVCIEAINMLHRRRMKPVHLRNPYGPQEPIFIPGDRPGSTTLAHQREPS